MIADIPVNFEILQSILEQAKKHSNEVVLLLLKINKKYLNMLAKKLSAASTKPASFTSALKCTPATSSSARSRQRAKAR